MAGEAGEGGNQTARQAFVGRAECLLRRSQNIKVLNADGIEALTSVADRANALGRAMARLSRCAPASASLVNAWGELTRKGKSHPTLRLPDEADLKLMAQAAGLWLPPKKEPNRPKDFGPNFLILLLLAAEFGKAFCVLPKTSDKSPFVKFCRVAFPLHGLKQPSREKIDRAVKMAEIGWKSTAES